MGSYTVVIKVEIQAIDEVDAGCVTSWITDRLEEHEAITDIEVS